jgi:hypothetical protein
VAGVVRINLAPVDAPVNIMYESTTWFSNINLSLEKVTEKNGRFIFRYIGFFEKFIAGAPSSFKLSGTDFKSVSFSHISCRFTPSVTQMRRQNFVAHLNGEDF